MRLLFVHNHPVWDPRSAGGQQVNHELAVHGVLAGHEVTVLHVGGARQPPGVPPPYGLERTADTGRVLLNAILVARAVRRICLRSRVQAVWASAPEGGFIPRTLPPGVGLIATQHHPAPPPLPRLRWWPHPLRTMNVARRWQQPLLEAALLRGAHRVTVPSVWSRNAVVAGGYVRDGQEVFVLPNGVGASWFEPTTPIAHEGRTDFLFVGRLEYQKGIDLLLRALARTPLAGATLRIVGSGPQEAELRSMASALGLLDRVRFDGHRTHEDIRRSMQRCGALVLPSRAESFGLVALEAMAAGLPVVAAAVGGVPEFNRTGDAALLVPPEDVTALGVALRRILDDPTLRSRLVEHGRDVAEAHRSTRLFPEAAEHIECACVAASSGRKP